MSENILSNRISPLQFHRQNAGYKQIEVSVKTKISPSRLCQLEKGWFQPRPDELKKLGKLYGLEVSELMKPIELSQDQKVNQGK